VATGDGAKLSLASPLPLQLQDDEARATFPLRSGETAAFVLRWDEEAPRPIADYDIPCKLGNTEAYWRLKTSDWHYRGRWSELVKRSVLALHQLLYAPSGAICAAVTTSLPGQIGGPRNWDYRFCWLRDAAFTLDVFHRLGHTDDTSPFLGWLSHFSAAFPNNLHTLYGIGYETDIEERVLDHLEGYRGSRPVRVGNAAGKQLQLDDYGELLLALASYYRAGGYIDDSFWRLAETLVEGAVANWRLPDHGIWEMRAERRHYVYSKLMLGGRRPGHPPGAGPGQAGGPRPLAAGARGDSRRRAGQRLQPQAGRLRSVVWFEHPRRQSAVHAHGRLPARRRSAHAGHHRSHPAGAVGGWPRTPLPPDAGGRRAGHR
jgi:hypothetical protein